MNEIKNFAEEILEGIPDYLPQPKSYEEEVSHAPVRDIKSLSKEEKQLALKNALRYFPEKFHEILAPEFAEELEQYGRIYMYRYRPVFPIEPRPIEDYPCKTRDGAAIMLMIQNNLCDTIAKHPRELITYGGNGAVFQNWAQYRLCMKYLAEMTEDQTLVLYSGHPHGLFPSSPHAPRVVVTNGMMIPNYSSTADWNKYNALGVTQYGQMTAGSFMYIGPQGIIHGTTITLLNAGRRKEPGIQDLKGKLFVSSGLGGMSGAQTRAGEITAATSIIAEVDPDAIQQRITDGYVCRENVYSNLDRLIDKAREARDQGNGISLIYSGNIVDLWEALAEKNIDVDFGSDQTSLHNIADLGYCPVGYSFEEAKELLYKDKRGFLTAVRQSLIRHVAAVNRLTEKGMYFWDYGNAFLKEAGESGAEIWKNKETGQYRYSSYVEDIMGPMCFDYGFGPFRWVCTSATMEDLQTTDKIAEKVLVQQYDEAPGEIKGQLSDNIKWIREAAEKIPNVGSKSRILYADSDGRIAIARAFNDAIRKGELKAPVVLGRDHHDVSGTDSPFRETANIYDGSKYTADMAVHNVIGDAFRGATWVSLHNGGGVGWGEVINGGFGMVLDGTEKADKNLESMLFWDVNNGIARRSWARNDEAIFAIKRAMKNNPMLKVTLPHIAGEKLVENAFDRTKKSSR